MLGLSTFLNQPVISFGFLLSKICYIFGFLFDTVSLENKGSRPYWCMRTEDFIICSLSCLTKVHVHLILCIFAAYMIPVDLW